MWTPQSLAVRWTETEKLNVNRFQLFRYGGEFFEVYPTIVDIFTTHEKTSSFERLLFGYAGFYSNDFIPMHHISNRRNLYEIKIPLVHVSASDVFLRHAQCPVNKTM